jgi:GntR family transcriptional regulator
MTEKRPSIQFRLDTRSGVVPYRQLVNPNPVHRAYRELEHQGIAEGRSGLGTFITSHARSFVGTTNSEGVEEDIRAWVRRARSIGMDDERIADLVSAALRQVGEVFS